MKYKVEYKWSGYSRGYATVIVEAESEDEARGNWWWGEEVDREVIRDDTECDHDSIKVTACKDEG